MHSGVGTGSRRLIRVHWLTSKHGCRLIGRKSGKLRKTKTQFHVKSLCSAPPWLFKRFHNNTYATFPVQLDLRFPMTHDGRSEIEVKGPCGAFTNGKTVRGFFWSIVRTTFKWLFDNILQHSWGKLWKILAVQIHGRADSVVRSGKMGHISFGGLSPFGS